MAEGIRTPPPKGVHRGAWIAQERAAALHLVETTIGRFHLAEQDHERWWQRFAQAALNALIGPDEVCRLGIESLDHLVDDPYAGENELQAIAVILELVVKPMRRPQ